MKSAALTVIALSLFVPVSYASAEDAAPKTTATRPAKEHPQETSVPNNAPPATANSDDGIDRPGPDRSEHECGREEEARDRRKVSAK